MGDDDEGDADFVLQALQLKLHGAAQLLVERAERLVQQQQARPLDQGARQRHALLLAARELLRLAVGEGHELRRRKDGIDAVADFPCRQPFHLQPVGDISPDAHVREQRVGLEHQDDGPLVGRRAGNVAPVEHDAAFAGRLETGQHAQQRGLAASRRTEQGEELVLADVEADAVDRRHPAEILRNAVDGKQGARLVH